MDLVAIVRDDPHVSDQALRPGMWKFRMRGALLQSLNPLLQQERVVGDDMKCGIRRRVRISAGGGHQIATFLGKELMPAVPIPSSEEQTSELQSLMRISYAVFCLKNKQQTISNTYLTHPINHTTY